MRSEEIRRVADLNRTPGAFDNEVQAAEWLVRLDADPSAATLSLWLQWLSKDARHHAAFARLEARWRQVDCLRSLRPLDGRVDADLLDTFPGVRPRSRPRRRRWWRWHPSNLRAPYGELAVAAAASALAGLLVLTGWLFLVTLDAGVTGFGTAVIRLVASSHTAAND
jgi:ferric-dicitrate binding protein FerR (iron transport regulator)